MKPNDYIQAIYKKDKSIKYVADMWVPIYLSKIMIQEKANADAMEKAIQYCLYLSPTHYYYLLYLLIPKNFNYSYKAPTKKEEAEEDLLVEKAKSILGWSNKEFELNKREFTKTILANRAYWEDELAVEQPKKRTKK